MFETLERRRLLAAGDPDLSFGDNGFLDLPQLNGGASNPNVVAAGNDQFYFTGVSRLYKRDADGNPVNSFGGDGRVDLPSEFPQLVIPLAGGDLLVLGETSVTDQQAGVVNTTFYLIRLNGDGSFDTGFGGGDGIVILNDAMTDAHRFQQVAAQSDGKVIVHGWTSKPAGGPGEGTIPESVIRRLNADGTADGTFTEMVFSSIDVGALAVQADNKILAGGNPTIDNGTPFSVVRLNVNGGVDTTFGTNGFIPL